MLNLEKLTFLDNIEKTFEVNKIKLTKDEADNALQKLYNYYNS